MTRSLAFDFGPRQITVNCIVPGGENMRIEQIDALTSRNSPLGRPGCPEDAAGVVSM